MSNVLDLSVFKEETLDITMPEGNVLHIMKPTQAMVIKMLQLRAINDKTAPEVIVKEFNALALAILNSNDAAKVYTNEQIENMSMGMKSAIIEAYGKFITGLQNNPN